MKMTLVKIIACLTLIFAAFLASIALRVVARVNSPPTARVVSRPAARPYQRTRKQSKVEPIREAQRIPSTPIYVPPSGAGSANQLAVIAWNVESGGNNPAVIAEQLKEMAGYDVYCLNEVHPDSLERYAAAMPEGFIPVNSTTGGGDRMQISFDGKRFELLHAKELHLSLIHI